MQQRICSLRSATHLSQSSFLLIKVKAMWLIFRSFPTLGLKENSCEGSRRKDAELRRSRHAERKKSDGVELRRSEPAKLRKPYSFEMPRSLYVRLRNKHLLPFLLLNLPRFLRRNLYQ